MKNKLKVVTCNYVHTIVVLIFVYKERKKARERERERDREEEREGGREGLTSYNAVVWRTKRW